MSKNLNQTSRRRSGGGGYIVFFLFVAAAAGVVYFAGDKVRGMLGMAGRPANQGAEPSAPEAVSSNTPVGEHEDNLPMGGVNTAQKQAAPSSISPIPTTAAPTVKTYKDQVRANALLLDAEKKYKTFQWQLARSAADQILGMDINPKSAARARDISTGALAIEKLFKALDDRDELIRNYDTSPSLVQIGEGSSAMFVVPVVEDPNGKEPQVVENDPVKYIETAGASGKVTAMVKGRKEFICAQLPDALSTITLVDQKKVRSEKEQEFNSKLAALKNDPAASRDAMRWYDAAKYAYRNRLDDQVTSMLDQALDLDPELVKSVREDKAARLYASMILHLKNNNRKQADTYMAIIHRKYSDTDQGKQAQAYYEGNMNAMLAMAMDEDNRRKEDAEKRTAARIQKAKAAGDDQKVAAIQNEKPIDDAPATIINGNPDESAAEKAYQDGLKIYSKANDMPATSERNTCYKEAGHHFAQAVAIYRKLCEKDPKNETLQTKMVEANKLKFGAEKYITAF